MKRIPLLMLISTCTYVKPRLKMFPQTVVTLRETDGDCTPISSCISCPFITDEPCCILNEYSIVFHMQNHSLCVSEVLRYLKQQ